MSYSHLSMLQTILSQEQIDGLGKYFSNLIGGAKENILASAIMENLGFSLDVTQRVLKECTDNKILKRVYGIRCPKCGMLIKKVETIDEIPESEDCYICDESFDSTLENVEVIYELIDEDFFNDGQRLIVKQSVAPENTLRALFESGNVHDIFYKPSEEDYGRLNELYEYVISPSMTTKEQGTTLEKFVSELFSLCEVLATTTEMRTDTNQIDCFVRNQVYIPYGIFNEIGGRFIIECKNEKKTPSGTYMSKLHSIITTINGKKNGSFIKFGIIVSRVPGPSTFQTLAHSYYLADDIVIIAICLDEIKKLLTERANLLDLLELKYTEIVMNATKNLEELGLM